MLTNTMAENRFRVLDAAEIEAVSGGLSLVVQEPWLDNYNNMDGFMGALNQYGPFGTQNPFGPLLLESGSSNGGVQVEVCVLNDDGTVSDCWTAGPGSGNVVGSFSIDRDTLALGGGLAAGVYYGVETFHVVHWAARAGVVGAAVAGPAGFAVGVIGGAAIAYYIYQSTGPNPAHGQ